MDKQVTVEVLVVAFKSHGFVYTEKEKAVYLGGYSLWLSVKKDGKRFTEVHQLTLLVASYNVLFNLHRHESQVTS